MTLNTDKKSSRDFVPMETSSSISQPMNEWHSARWQVKQKEVLPTHGTVIKKAHLFLLWCIEESKSIALVPGSSCTSEDKTNFSGLKKYQVSLRILFQICIFEQTVHKEIVCHSVF